MNVLTRKDSKLILYQGLLKGIGFLCSYGLNLVLDGCENVLVCEETIKMLCMKSNTSNMYKMYALSFLCSVFKLFRSFRLLSLRSGHPPGHLSVRDAPGKYATPGPAARAAIFPAKYDLVCMTLSPLSLSHELMRHTGPNRLWNASFAVELILWRLTTRCFYNGP